MYIATPKPDFLNRENAEQELERLLAQPSVSAARPCPGCRLPVNCGTVAANDPPCHAGCENAPQALSSEPELHPIEKDVVAIVFELTALRLIQPCWSCEGHLDGRGELWKLPQVSFYAASPLYPKLICNYLTRLRHQKQLHYVWQVNLVDYGQTWSPAYQIEPCLNQISKPVELTLLQEDLRSIGNNLAEQIKQEARHMLANMRRDTSTSL
ncbi:MAG: hypothetical protein OEZ39_06890 [Gammaproteobacteria bacterium]|nr:hypothetical protein [Gammaproteobacteria bacterium]MDH5651582.1 hypothetical protein [Gammaproteobacteria bacterium]